MTMTIAALFPRPREVVLGGRAFLVGELRLSDLADLQDWLDRRWESPLDGLDDRLEGFEGAARRDVLSEAWDAADAGPVAWGSEASNRLFRTGPGIVEKFRVIVHQYQPGLTVEQIEAIADGTSPEQYYAMLDAWHRVDPIEVIERLLGVDPGDRGGTIGWPQIAMELCEIYGWTIEYVMSLTLRQLRLAGRGGKPVARGTAVAPKKNLRQVVAEARRKFQKMDKGING